jgi:hypothetical protein
MYAIADEQAKPIILMDTIITMMERMRSAAPEH